MSTRKKIDIHTHILPEVIPNFHERFGVGEYITLDHFTKGKARMMTSCGTVFREVEQNCWSIEARIAEMDASGIDVQVLSTVPVMFNYSAPVEHAVQTSRFLNDHLAECVKRAPDRFIALGTLPMQDAAAACAELQRCRYELGFPGVQIGSHVNDWNLDAKELEPFWDAAEKHSCSVFVHPWGMQTDGRFRDYWFPWLIDMPRETTVAICSLLFGGVIERHPRLRVCFAHGGGSFPYTLGRIEHGFRERPDLCAIRNQVAPLEYVRRGQIFCDSLVHDERALHFLCDVIGENNVLLGSDYPFPLGEHVAGSMIEATTELSTSQKDKILRENVLRFLNLQNRDEHNLNKNNGEHEVNGKPHSQ